MIGWRYLDLVTEVETISNVTGQRAMVKRLVVNAVAAIAASYDWPFLWTESFFTTVAEYTTGTIAVTNGSSTVTGSSTTFPAASAGRKIRVSGETAYYPILTRDSATQLTLRQPYQGTTQSGKSYSLYQDVYLLRADVDKQKLIRQIQFGVALKPVHVSAFDKSVAAPNSLGSANFEIKVGRQVDTYTTGTVSMSGSSRVLTGSGTSWTTVPGLGRGSRLNIGQVIFTVNTVDSDTQITTYELNPSAIAGGTSYTAILDNPLVQLYTIPNVVENYYYRFQRIPAVLDADGDIPDLIPPMHPLIIRWVLTYLWEHKGSIDRASQSQKLYDILLTKMILHYGSDHADRVYRRRPNDIQSGRFRAAQFPDNVGVTVSVQ